MPASWPRCLLLAAVMCAASGPAVGSDDVAHGMSRLYLDPRWGVIVRTPRVTVRLDRNAYLTGPVVRLRPEGVVLTLAAPTVVAAGPSRLRLVYHVPAPHGPAFTVERTLTLSVRTAATELTESFALTTSTVLHGDLEIERPFSVAPARPAADGQALCGGSAVFPLQNGWARSYPLTEGGVQAEYRLGNVWAGSETPQLALPILLVSSGRSAVALCADPTFSAQFQVHLGTRGIEGSVRYCYAATRVPIRGTERRMFGLRVAPQGGRRKDIANALDAFFRLMLPDVPPGPNWLHDIAMVHYDYLSDGGRGWERDVRTLANWLSPEKRRHVALCFHGWYDALGFYCYDRVTGELKDEWVAFGPTQKLKLTKAEVKRRLRLARNLGFRVLLYFADGLAMDSGFPGYRDDWVYRDANGNRLPGWQGPDTYGPTYLLNPAHPEVARWFCDYLDALMATYGPDVDGFVWDETFHATIGQIATTPEPAYCDRAMLTLVRTLRENLKKRYSQKAFLTSDCIGVFGWSHVPGYGMVADGTYQDTHCDPAAWSYGLFPNWRNTLWSCNWSPLSNFHYTGFGVERFGAPVAISNGWGDGRGPSEWQPWERDAVLRLFRHRLRSGPRTRMLLADPEMLLADSPDRGAAGDPLPTPGPGEVNWASAEHGSRAAASSEDDYGGGTWGPSGVIDGIRDDTGWGSGNGWASKVGQPLPQWLEIDFGRPRALTRFVVITYQSENTTETAAKWGVRNYDVQARQPHRHTWRTLVHEAGGRAVKVRVHHLPRPVCADRIRIVVRDVAPLDGAARLLEFEAWGPRDEPCRSDGRGTAADGLVHAQ